jgi:hypothetical protein
MRDLNTIQKGAKLNAVSAVDQPGNGGLNYRYHIVSNKSGSIVNVIQFQNGARNSKSLTEGAVDSDLLEIVRDRLKSFQSGPFAYREHAIALTHVEEALMWLNKRLDDRIEKASMEKNNKK